MLSVPCPWCGPRNADEFRFVGDVRSRPDPTSASPETWRAYLYLERNEAGWTTETWYHRAGCRRYFVAERHRTSNEFRGSRPPSAQARP
jgi:heterotetrameric sarcosine oxidase delta subunit